MADDLRPIESAPRDGTLIWVCAPQDGYGAPMRWNKNGSNAIFQPLPVGIWELDGGGATWSEEGGYGPTHWMPLPSPPKESPNG